MKNFLRISGKVVLIAILLFLCFSFKPRQTKALELFGHEIKFDFKLDFDFDILHLFDKNKKEKTVEEAIEEEKGGLFETTIAKALGGIAQAVFNVASSDKVNLGFKKYDSLIFNSGEEESGYAVDSISPFTYSTWKKVMQWYTRFSILAFVPILIGAILTSYKFIIAGNSVTKRNDAKDSFLRLFLGGAAIALAPIFVKLVLLINANMVSVITSTGARGLDSLLGNNIFSEIETGSAIATALVICLFAYLYVKINIKFIIRKFTLIVFTVFTPLIAGMWIINKNVTGAAIWFGQIMVNAFMQFVYAFLFLIYLDFTSVSDGWAASLLWAMMILPLGDVLLNTMQNLVSRIAGVNNEEMANRGIGLGAAMGYTVHSIASQFKTNNNNGGILNRIKNTGRNESTNNMINNENTTSTSITKTAQSTDRASTNILDKKPKNKMGSVSLYGIGRSFLNTGMFLAEGRNFADKGLTGGNRRNYGMNNRENEINTSVTHNLQNESMKTRLEKEKIENMDKENKKDNV